MRFCRLTALWEIASFPIRPLWRKKGIWPRLLVFHLLVQSSPTCKCLGAAHPTGHTIRGTNCGGCTSEGHRPPRLHDIACAWASSLLICSLCADVWAGAPPLFCTACGQVQTSPPTIPVQHNDSPHLKLLQDPPWHYASQGLRDASSSSTGSCDMLHCPIPLQRDWVRQQKPREGEPQGPGCCCSWNKVQLTNKWKPRVHMHPMGGQLNIPTVESLTACTHDAMNMYI